MSEFEALTLGGNHCPCQTPPDSGPGLSSLRLEGFVTAQLCHHPQLCQGKKRSLYSRALPLCHTTRHVSAHEPSRSLCPPAYGDQPHAGASSIKLFRLLLSCPGPGAPRGKSERLPQELVSEPRYGAENNMCLLPPAGCGQPPRSRAKPPSRAAAPLDRGPRAPSAGGAR